MTELKTLKDLTFGWDENAIKDLKQEAIKLIKFSRENYIQCVEVKNKKFYVTYYKRYKENDKYIKDNSKGEIIINGHERIERRISLNEYELFMGLLPEQECKLLKWFLNITEEDLK